ncbi:hypothetical protein BU15DRAFT_82970 [Melanogaster broomeanus]|nr:hypothetical protein BU15DRAFT_82970 [Melanogaster broomeanus]
MKDWSQLVFISLFFSCDWLQSGLVLGFYWSGNRTLKHYLQLRFMCSYDGPIVSAAARRLMDSLPLEQCAQGSVWHAGPDASAWVLSDPIWDLCAAACHAAILLMRAAGTFCLRAASFTVRTHAVSLACMRAVCLPLGMPLHICSIIWGCCTFAVRSRAVAAAHTAILLPLER